MSKITPRSTGRDAVAMLLERDTVARCEERRRTSEERAPNMRSSRVPEGVMDGPLMRKFNVPYVTKIKKKDVLELFFLEW